MTKDEAGSLMSPSSRFCSTCLARIHWLGFQSLHWFIHVTATKVDGRSTVHCGLVRDNVLQVHDSAQTPQALSKSLKLQLYRLGLVGL